MKKLSLTVKISILVAGLILALLLLAAFFVSQFSSVIRSSQQDSSLRQFEAELVSHWDNLKSQYNLARVQAPEFFSKKLDQADLEATINNAKSIELLLLSHFEGLDSSISASWDAANIDEAGDLESFTARFNEAITSSQDIFDSAAMVWIEKGAWNQRSAADKGVVAAMIPIDEATKEFSQRFGALVSYRSSNLITSQKATIRSLMISLVVLVLFVVAVSVTVLRKLKRDLHSIVSLTNQMAQGDLSHVISAQKNGDEVDEVMFAVSVMTEKLRSVMESVVGLADHLTLSSEKMLDDSQTRMAGAETQRDQLHSLTVAVSQLESYSAQVTHAASESQVVANGASKSADSGHNSVMETATAIETLAQEIEQAVKVIQKLDDRAESITAIISTIQAIAEQTNLLALNAAIEAARAGEQGRGFAVVADEVRNLAHRTQQSTEEIQETLEQLKKDSQAAVSVIGGSHTKSIESVKKATTAGEAIKEFDEAVESIKSHASQTATSAQQQSLTLQTISTTVTDVNTITGHNTEQASESINASEKLKKLSEDLADSISYFRLK